jgi:hypothetical protein
MQRRFWLALTSDATSLSKCCVIDYARAEDGIAAIHSFTVQQAIPLSDLRAGRFLRLEILRTERKYGGASH